MTEPLTSFDELFKAELLKKGINVDNLETEPLERARALDRAYQQLRTTSNGSTGSPIELALNENATTARISGKTWLSYSGKVGDENALDIARDLGSGPIKLLA